MPKRILIIDDDEAFCNMMSDILESAGYEVTTSTYPVVSAEDALSGGYDLVTLDLHMPNLDGLDIAGLFQAWRLDLPVLVISGYLNDTVTRQLREAGIRHFIKKPFNATKLLEKVEQVLAE